MGLPIRARATASICCSPPERSPARCAARSARTGKRSWTRSRAAERPGLLPPRAAGTEVVGDRHAGEHPSALRDLGDPGGDHPVRGQVVEAAAVQGHRAPGDRAAVKGEGPADRPQQGRLAGRRFRRAPSPRTPRAPPGTPGAGRARGRIRPTGPGRPVRLRSSTPPCPYSVWRSPQHRRGRASTAPGGIAAGAQRAGAAVVRAHNTACQGPVRGRVRVASSGNGRATTADRS